MATTTGQRKAMVVASYDYEDPRLRRLRAPSQDARELAEVMGDPTIGGFDVEILSNPLEYVLRRKISSFFKEASREDFLLLHFACHGVKDEDGRLYFATSDTQIDDLAATAVRSEFVNEAMLSSRSNQIVLLLDCCYSGAFSRGMTPRADDGVQLKERLHGRGRAVITASDSTEYAWEGDQLAGEGASSVFTSAVVEGLQSGEADFDKDGRVSIDDLYDYVSDRLGSGSSSQTPRKWSDLAGDLYIALNPRAAEQITLPAELTSALQSSVSTVRMGVIDELKRLALGTHFGYAAAARRTLTDLAERDDSRTVSSAAAQALQSIGEPPPHREAVQKDSQQEADRRARDEEEKLRRQADRRARGEEEKSRREADRRTRDEEEKLRREADRRTRDEEDELKRKAVQSIRRDQKPAPDGSADGVPVWAGVSALVGAVLLLYSFLVQSGGSSLSESGDFADVLTSATLTAAIGIRLLLRRMPNPVWAPGILFGLSLFAILDLVSLPSSFQSTSVPTGIILGLLLSAAATSAASWLSRRPGIAYAEGRVLTPSRVGSIAITIGIVLLLLGGSLLVGYPDVDDSAIAIPIAVAVFTGALFAMWRVPRLRMVTAAALLAIGVQLAISSVASVTSAAADDLIVTGYDFLIASLIVVSGTSYAVGGISVFLSARSAPPRVA